MQTKTRTSHTVAPFLRRATAICLALFGLALLFAAPMGEAGSLFARLGESPRLVSAALRATLGVAPGGSETASASPVWERVLLSESPLLSGWNGGGKEEGVAAAEDPESEDHENVKPVGDGQVVERFFKASDTESYARADDVYLLNKTKKTPDLAAIAALTPPISLQAGAAPEILIMHTHGSESYTQDGADVYQETGVARTTDNNYNITRVGDEIERIFTEMGFSVLHDRTLHDYPSYNGAYDRSKAAVEQYLRDYPSIKIVLDVHRDALVGNDGTIYKAVTELDAVKTAQVLFVIGTDDGGLSHPNWEQNLNMAMRIQHRMNTLWPGLARPIALRSSRFNQQLAPASMLVEIGSHGNTLQEALAGARLFARSAGQVFLELKA